MSEPGKSPSIVAVLESRELAVVKFVQDYIQLLFQGPNTKDCILTTFTWPVVEVDRVKYQPVVSGYRDALCALIGREVQMAEVEEGVDIRVSFVQGGALRVSLRAEESDGLEVAMLDDGENLYMW